MYTAVGGLKATFLTDYLHTAIALILIIYFTLAILTHDAIGGLYGLYDKVSALSDDNFIPGNFKGSLLFLVTGQTKLVHNVLHDIRQSSRRIGRSRVRRRGPRLSR